MLNAIFPCANFESSRARLKLEAFLAPTSESECEGSNGDDGAGLLSSLFISTTDATDVPPFAEQDVGEVQRRLRSSARSTVRKWTVGI